MMAASLITRLLRVVEAHFVSALEVFPVGSPGRQLSSPDSLPLTDFELPLLGAALGLLLYVDFAVLQAGVCGRFSFEAVVCFAG